MGSYCLDGEGTFSGQISGDHIKIQLCSSVSDSIPLKPMRNEQVPRGDLPDVIDFIHKIDHACKVGAISFEHRVEILDKLTGIGQFPKECGNVLGNVQGKYKSKKEHGRHARISTDLPPAYDID